MPSYNTWNICGKAAAGETCVYRPAGGHIHFGLPEAYKNEEQIEIIVRRLMRSWRDLCFPDAES